MTTPKRTAVPQPPEDEIGRDWQCPDCGEVFTIVPGWRKLPDVACADCRRRWNGLQWSGAGFMLFSTIASNFLRDRGMTTMAIGIALVVAGILKKAIRHGALRGGGFLDEKR